MGLITKIVLYKERKISLLYEANKLNQKKSKSRTKKMESGFFFLFIIFSKNVASLFVGNIINKTLYESKTF